MKRLLTFLLVVLTAAPAVSQVLETFPDILINRWDKQTESRWQHTVATTPTTPNYFHTLLDNRDQKPMIGTEPLSIHFETQRKEFDPSIPADGDIKAHLVNNTDSALRLVFRRWQTLPTDQWLSSVCFGDLCYISFVDSLPWSDNYPYFELPAKGETIFKLAVNAPAGSTDSLIAYIRFDILNTPEVDSVGYYLVAVAKEQNSIGSTSIDSRFSIRSIFPSPLVNGNSIKVKLMSPAHTGYSYTIYDNLGREVAFGSTRQQLNFGENTIEINELDGLVNGSYLLRIKSSNGASDAIPFQVIK